MKLPCWLRRLWPDRTPELPVMESPPTDHAITTRVVEVLEQLVVLDKLGGADRIASYLEWSGVTGVRGDADRCPVKKLLGPDVTVGIYNLSVSGAQQTLNIPRCVRTFIVLFDDGQYPFLEAK
jgi:hypothetical protein